MEKGRISSHYHDETTHLVTWRLVPAHPAEHTASLAGGREALRLATRGGAARINELMANPELQKKFGRAGRKRAEEKFGWPAIARETKRLYETLVGRSNSLGA